MTTLTEPEQKLVALALFSYVMRAGPWQFEQVIATADKIGVTDKLHEYANNWLATAKDSQDEQVRVTEGTATIQFAIFHAITTQWHHKDSILFPKILTQSVYKELFETKVYKEDIIDLLTKT